MDGDFGSVVTRGAAGAEVANATAYDLDGNGVVAGSFTGTVDFAPGGVNVFYDSANGSGYVAKYTPAGDFLWARQVGGAVSDVAVDKYGNILVTGSFGGTKDFDSTAGTTNLSSQGFEDIFIAKFNSTGALQWAKGVGSSQYSDFGHGIAVDHVGNAYVGGRFAGIVDFNPGLPADYLEAQNLYDGFVLRLSAGGNFLRVSQLAGGGNEYVTDVASDAIGNVYATGRFDGTADFNPGAGSTLMFADASLGGNFDGFVWKIKSNGGFGFARRFGGGLYDGGESIAIDALGNSYVTGRFTYEAWFNPGTGGKLFAYGNSGSDAFVAKYDNQGGYEWSRKIGGGEHDESGTGIAVDGARNVYVTGYFRGIASLSGWFLVGSSGGTDGFFAKFDTDGSFKDGAKFGGTGNDVGRGIAVDAVRGNVWTAGSFSNTVDFDPDAGVVNRTSGGGTDLFLLRLEQTPSPLHWAFSAGFGTSEDEGRHVATDSNGNVYIAGVVRGYGDLDPSAGWDGFGPIGSGGDVFVAKFAPDGTFLWSRVASHRENDPNFGDEKVGGLAVDWAGNVVVVGSFRTADFEFDFPNTDQDLTSPNTATDGFVWKLNANGGHVFAARFGDTGVETADGVAVDDLGYVYVTGTFDYAVKWGPGEDDEIFAGNFGAGELASQDVWVAKYSPTGAIQWATASGSDGDDAPADIVVDTDNGHVHVVGTFDGAVFYSDRSYYSPGVARKGTADGFVARYSTGFGSGNQARTLGGNGVTRATAVDVDADGDVFVGGDFTGTTDFDTTNGTFNRTSKGGSDLFVTKMTANGARLFSSAIGGTQDDTVAGLDVGPDGNVHVTGWFRGNVDFNTSFNQARNLDGGIVSSYALKLSNAGAFRAAYKFANGANGIAAGANDDVHVVGTFTSTGADFDPGTESFLLEAQPSDIFLMKFRPGTTPSTPQFPVEGIGGGIGGGGGGGIGGVIRDAVGGIRGNVRDGLSDLLDRLRR